MKSMELLRLINGKNISVDPHLDIRRTKLSFIFIIIVIGSIWIWLVGSPETERELFKIKKIDYNLCIQF